MQVEQAQVPFKAWVVMPSFKVKEIELVSEQATWLKNGEYFKTRLGKVYHISQLYRTHIGAIYAAEDALKKIAFDLAKRQLSYEKKKKAVEKLLQEAAHANP
ncbi:hypothetical protein [Chromobacterium violaceum]|uniref:hypothetical protein n=1 Tax=Chromobacterium violaceum TaxID=536 RepID=UPI001C8B3CC0|nr:hypothetical protein [Chromobacterium violaceum]MBX9267262.1 hypothetical protein [Chromobacterium violaceum]